MLFNQESPFTDGSGKQEGFRQAKTYKITLILYLIYLQGKIITMITPDDISASVCIFFI